LGFFFTIKKETLALEVSGGDTMESDEMLYGWEDQMFEELRERKLFSEEDENGIQILEEAVEDVLK